MISTSFGGIPIVFRMFQRELRSRESNAALRSFVRDRNQRSCIDASGCVMPQSLQKCDAERTFALHFHPQYSDACSAVFNEEWPRNATARYCVIFDALSLVIWTFSSVRNFDFHFGH